MTKNWICFVWFCYEWKCYVFEWWSGWQFDFFLFVYLFYFFIILSVELNSMFFGNRVISLCGYLLFITSFRLAIDKFIYCGMCKLYNKYIIVTKKCIIWLKVNNFRFDFRLALWNWFEVKWGKGLKFRYKLHT